MDTIAFLKGLRERLARLDVTRDPEDAKVLQQWFQESGWQSIRALVGSLLTEIADKAKRRRIEEEEARAKVIASVRELARREKSGEGTLLTNKGGLMIRRFDQLNAIPMPVEKDDTIADVRNLAVDVFELPPHEFTLSGDNGPIVGLKDEMTVGELTAKKITTLLLIPIPQATWYLDENLNFSVPVFLQPIASMTTSKFLSYANDTLSIDDFWKYTAELIGVKYSYAASASKAQLRPPYLFDVHVGSSTWGPKVNFWKAWKADRFTHVSAKYVGTLPIGLV